MKVVADIDIDGYEFFFRPGVDRQMRFSEQYCPGDAMCANL